MTIAKLMAARGKAFDALQAHGTKKDFAPADQPEYDRLKADVIRLDGEITRAKETQELAAKSAVPVAGQETQTGPAAAETDKYVKEKSLIIGGVCKMLGMGGGNIYGARQAAADLYGENHPVTKALVTSVGASGGLIVPPDVSAEIIELLRPRAVVRAAGPRLLPMPRGTMTLPGQGSAATAGYGAEGSKISKSQQTLKGIVASFKKMTALVPVSNDMMRYANPAVDAFVRDDLVKVVALREDKAFLLDDGTQDTPRGFLSFANAYGTTAGVYFNSANSTAAAGGNWITSTLAYTLATVAAELGGAVNKLDTADVPDDKRCWFMHPRSFNYLYNVQNSLGVYVYRDELNKGTLLSYPFKKSTQFPINLYDTTGANQDCSFVMLAEMTEAIILDSMQLELAVSREGTYYDENGNLVSAFAKDETVIRAIAEHDFQMRHDSAVAIIQFVRWAPAIS